MIQQDFEAILERYTRARTGEPFNGEHEIFKYFESIRESISQSEVVKNRPHIRVKFSAGQGNWARVPWIAFLDSRETSTTQKGVYCVYLFRQDMSGLYVTFNQGVTELINQNGRPRAHQELQRRAKEFQQYCDFDKLKGFTLGQGIDLRADPGLGADYEYSTIAYKLYETGKIPIDATILSDLDTTLMAYDNYLNKTPMPTPPIAKPVTPQKQTNLPKPFLLLAGISGTGKTRFVREQSRASADLHGIPQGDNYCLVPVRPDWHEPSDLLGYISRIGNDGARYIVTDLLRFIVAAWKHTVKSASGAGIDYKEFDSVCPFWLCLDEMNLAPVEQYFADYLSIIETRKWEDGSYSCDSFLKPAVINQQLDEIGRADLWEKLEIAGDDPLHTGLREYFSAKGIPLPPNLIVAGTVNMDETTHGFSRKVIDRALTIDFGEFFPNDYDEYYEADRKHTVKPLSFPRLSGVHQESDLASVPADPDGRRTIVFLKSINEILDNTPFKLAYRALNEALLSVVCFQPSDDLQLQAVWDDFLMMKVLPRIEGDAEKLGYEGEETGLLFRLIQLLKQLLPASRPDLLRMAADGDSSPALCRSLKKLEWMQKRLAGNSFTAFWP